MTPSRNITLLMVISIIACSRFARAQDRAAHDLVDDGNKAYASGEYDAALEAYDEADLARPDSPEIAFNKAATQFQLGNYDEAERLFNQALATENQTLEANAKYNLGNCNYASALEKMDAPKEAIDRLKSAMRRYRDALAIDPGDEDAKTNINMAQGLIKQLVEQLQQQEQQQQNQDQDQEKSEDENQDQQQQQNQDGDKNEQEQNENDKQNQQDQSSEDQQQQDQEQNQQQQQQNQQQNDQTQSQQEQEAAPQEMTQQEAERLLQAVRDREKKRREERAKRLRAKHVPVLRDW